MLSKNSKGEFRQLKFIIVVIKAFCSSAPCLLDWVKISEMLLGKVPDGFEFEPKHKANSYK